MKQFFLGALSLMSLTGFTQRVFFTSPTVLEEGELKGFYASIREQGNIILFNAPDYKLYAYDKNTGAEKWKYDTRWRSNIAPFIVDDQLWVKTKEGTVQLQLDNGQKTKDLVFETVYTQPIKKDSLLYFTGIYGGGNLFAYHPKGDSIIWQRFLAHGCMEKPYYLPNKIVANAEGTNWIELNYSGKMKDASCEIEEGQIPSESPCAKQFLALTHDGSPLTNNLVKELYLDESVVPEVLTTSKNTFIIGNNNEQLNIYGNKVKKRATIELFNVSDTLAAFSTDSLKYPDVSLTKLLKADDTHVWIVYYNHLLVYNHAKKTLDQLINLAAWEPHQILMDNNNLWIISKKDGRLYGVSI
jgi:outer membrane protein assembly factor BamB